MASPICIIPARGGSRRLPRKNVLPVKGRPMIDRVITVARQSGVFSEVYVSTEDSEIGQVASNAGAAVLERPCELSDDRTTVASVCKQVLMTVPRLPTAFCCIYATAIFVAPNDIEASWALMNAEPTPDFVLGVSAYNLPPVLALEEGADFAHYRWPEHAELKSQEQPELFAANGTLHWARTQTFLDQESLVGPKLRLYRFSAWRTNDIDTAEDYENALLQAERYLP